MASHRSSLETTALIGALLAAFVTAAAGCRSEAGPGADTAGLQRVVIGDRTFHLEIAADDASRVQGLSDRPSIPEDGGMLFVFPNARRLQFVMRRCLVPIDIIYLDPAGRVVQTHRMKVEPYDTPEDRLPRYGSRWPAQFAIELRGGTLDELGLEHGDEIALPLESLKAMAR